MSLLLLFFAAPLFGQFFDSPLVSYKRFGYYTHYGEEPRTYTSSNGSNYQITQRHFALASTYEIAKGLDSTTHVELSFFLDQFSYTNRTLFDKFYLTLGLGQEKRVFLGSHFAFRGLVKSSFQYFGTTEITNTDFTNVMVPAFQYLSTSAIQITNDTVRLAGVRLGASLELGTAWMPTEHWEFVSGLGAYGKIDFETVPFTDILPAAVVHYGFFFSQRIQLNFKLVQPFIQYQLFFLENEKGLVNNYALSTPIRQLFIIGVLFK
ncbi:MAG: hypothetical protein JNM63_10310, partial [Spirochaetia bacterium]|nr:hypothetical protein [Spirochaetia bacterium]